MNNDPRLVELYEKFRAAKRDTPEYRLYWERLMMSHLLPEESGNDNPTEVVVKQSVERLVHFECGKCRKWWTIGDAPDRADWYCPWCGAYQKVEISPKQ